MKQKQRRVRERQRRFLLLFILAAVLLSGGLSFSLALTHDLSPEMDEALFLKAGEDRAIRLFTVTATGTWEEERLYAGERCIYTPSEELPAHVKAAFVAMEDHRFYRHGGVDLIRTGKAVLERLFGDGSFGGSTITQQLIKNIGGEKEKTVTRKLREMVRAHLLEARHEKDEILTAYLNVIPMGEGCVGVGAAAECYFGKTPAELTLAEAASLVAIAPAPARLSPRRHPTENRARRDRVLSRMAALGAITEQERALAVAEPLVTKEEGARESGLSWFNEHLLASVKAGLVARGYTEAAASALLSGGGLRVYSAEDKQVQAAAEAALAAFEGDPALHAGTAVFSAKSGKLVALVGDRGVKSGSRLYSYVTDMRRAPGSTLKPLSLYAPAIDEGVITEASVFDDVPKTFTKTGVWPHNTPDRFDGLILAKDALIHSKNTVAVDLYRRLGAEHIYAILREKFGITGLCRRVTASDGSVRTDLAEAPLALGELTYGVSLFELSRAYLPFVREGISSAGDPFYRVEDREGRTLLSSDGDERRVLSPETASVMTHMLTGVVEEGSAKGLSLPTLVDTAGKTGSSGGNRDRWFVGYTPEYLCGVWCGYAEGDGAVEGQPHLSLFDAVMTPLYDGRTEGNLPTFSRAPGLREVKVCKDSGKMQTVLCNEDERGDRTAVVLLPQSTRLSSCETHVSVFYDDALDGVAYPPVKGREGSLRRVSLIHVPDRAFPVEVTVTDAEYVYRDPEGKDPPEGDEPFFAATVPEGVYIGKSHGGRPFHAAARFSLIPPFVRDPEEERVSPVPKREARRPRLPTLPRRALPRFRFFGI